MTYTEEVDELADIIEKIAEALIATPSWSDGDETWTTDDRTGNNARRCLYHSDGVYMALEAINQDNGAAVASGYRAKGLRITFSETWDDENHMWPEDNMQSFVQFEGHNGNVSADLATLKINHARWVWGDGFVLIGAPESSGDNYQGSFLVVVERQTDKFYDDGESNFFVYCRCSKLQYDNYNHWRHKSVIRPWVFQTNNTSEGRAVYLLAMKTVSGATYFMYPVYFNDRWNLKPVAQSKMVMDYDPNKGLADGDIIAVQGSTKKFKCKHFAGPDGGSLHIGVMYQE